MNRAVAAVGLVVVGAMVAGTAAAQELSTESVGQAIQRAIGYLKQQQRADGSWPDRTGFEGGVTALATLALLQAGVPADDPSMVRALERLQKLRINDASRTYTISLQTMVFCLVAPEKNRLRIAENVAWLESKQIAEGNYKGAWSYPGAAAGGQGDHSNSQFALLALHEAERVGVPVQGRTWRLAKAHWEKAQNPDGSWGYWLETEGTGSMTCAGIAALIITGGKIFAADARVAGDRIECCARGEGEDERIERGLQWLGRHFSVNRNPGPSSASTRFLLYYLYGVERVGRMTAQRFIGNHDWYREGAAVLVRTQDDWSGFWTGTGPGEDNPVVATSFALLFLSKGRRPVLMAKLRTATDDDWNQHRSDVNNLTRHIEVRWKRELTWQTVDLRAASVDDLLQTPVIYLCGSKSPLPTEADAQQSLAQKIRDYLDRGGFLFAEAYCGGTGFDDGFRKLMELVLPEREYRLRLLGAEHPIWKYEVALPPDQLRPLWGIDFGCRTSVVYAPLDPSAAPRPSLSCLWELSQVDREQTYSPGVRAQVDAGVGLGTNVLAYATNRQIKYKDEIPRVVVKPEKIDPVARGKMRIAKIRHLGGCDAAPRALANLLRAGADELDLRVETDQRMIDLADPSLFEYHLVFMHGRASFRLTDAERKALKTYVERGGILFADAICGNAAFVESFRREMVQVLGRPLERLPPTDPLFTPAYGGYDLTQVSRRTAGRGAGAAAPVVGPPFIEALRVRDGYGVIFSPYDLSCALEMHNSVECEGYTPEDAARIGLNVLLYSLQ